MVDIEYVDGLGLLVDPVPDAVLTSTGAPSAVVRRPQRGPDVARVGGKRPEDELDACRCHDRGGSRRSPRIHAEGCGRASPAHRLADQDQL
jgi:hypothetical protein